MHSNRLLKSPVPVVSDTDTPTLTAHRVWLGLILVAMGTLAGCGVWAIVLDRRWVEEEALERARSVLELAWNRLEQQGRVDLDAALFPDSAGSSESFISSSGSTSRDGSQSGFSSPVPRVPGMWVTSQSQWPNTWPFPPVPVDADTAVEVVESVPEGSVTNAVEQARGRWTQSGVPSVHGVWAQHLLKDAPDLVPEGDSAWTNLYTMLVRDLIAMPSALTGPLIENLPRTRPASVRMAEALQATWRDHQRAQRWLTGLRELNLLGSIEPSSSGAKQTEHWIQLDPEQGRKWDVEPARIRPLSDWTQAEWFTEDDAIRSRDVAAGADPALSHSEHAAEAIFVRLSLQQNLGLPESESESDRGEDGVTGAPFPSGERWGVQFFPESFLKERVFECFKDLQTLLPSYLGMELSLGSAPFCLDRTTAGGADMREQTFEAWRHDRTVEREDGPVRLRIGLTDPAALYTQHRRRAWILGGLLGGGVAVTLLGVLAAARGFRDQMIFSRRKTEFVSSVSHELRAPLASMQLLADSLARGTVHPERAPALYSLLVQETRRLGGLVQNVLDWSRIERGHKQYEMESTDLKRLTDATAHVMAPLFEAKQVTLLRVLPMEPLEGHVDGRALQQALVNLLDNASKHAPQGTQVRLEARCSRRRDPFAPGKVSDWIRWEVQDEGPGIPKELQEQIFDRFFRLGTELRRETPGVGIGLSLVRHIVQAHGGRVWVESEPGRGATFIMELPLCEGPGILPDETLSISNNPPQDRQA